jgi:hypothetical protein
VAAKPSNPATKAAQAVTGAAGAFSRSRAKTSGSISTAVGMLRMSLIVPNGSPTVKNSAMAASPSAPAMAEIRAAVAPRRTRARSSMSCSDVRRA